MTFVEAARCSGNSELQAVFRHVLPNTVAPLIVQGTYICAVAMLAESIGHGDQHFLRTTIGALAEQLARDNVGATAVILFGALAGADS